MVLDAFARYVGHMLAQVAADEVGMMLGVSGEIDKMGEKLLDLKNFLADADRRNITDVGVQEWVGQLKRAMYEATVILDLCQLKAMEHGLSSVQAECFNPLLFCMRNPFHAREIGTRIKALNKRLDAIKERSTAFNFIHLGSYKDHHSSSVHASRDANSSRETIGDFDRLGVVGEKIEEDTRELVAQIMQPRDVVNNMVVAIVGVGGIGKTTLAQKIFNDEAIKGEFSKKIWLSVNQNFNEVDLLRRAIIEAGGDAQPHGSAKNALHETLKDTLSGHKTFLVMDDVWDYRSWNDLLKMPLVNAAALGSRVLITTRNEGVARGLRATWPYHHVDTFAHDVAWSLLKKQVSGRRSDMVELIWQLRCGGVISVWGCPHGESTLFDKVYMGRTHKSKEFDGVEFDHQSWIDVPNLFDLVVFARHLFFNLHSDDLCEAKIAAAGVKMDDSGIIQGCCEFLREDNCLIVINSVKSNRDWDLIKATFLSDPTKGCILVITMESGVASYCVDEADRKLNINDLDADVVLPHSIKECI